MERRREEEEMPPPSNLPPAGTLHGLERMRNPGMPHVKTMPRDGHVVDRIFRWNYAVFESRDPSK